MPLSKDIAKEIDARSKKNEQVEIVVFLRDQLKEKKATAQDILEYAKKYQWSNKLGKPYVIEAATINLLGLAVAKSDDEQKDLAWQFYKLAAERDCAAANRNYAQCFLEGRYGLEKSKENALKYARKAVELTQGKPDKHEYKFILCKALRENQEYQKANIALIEYLTFKDQKLTASKEKSEKESLSKQIELAHELLEEIIAEFERDFKAKNIANLTNERCEDNLAELDPIIACKITIDKFNALKQQAYLIKAKCHEQLAETSEAWLAYCEITIEKLPCYQEAIKARIKMLKKKCREIIEDDKLAVTTGSLDNLDINAGEVKGEAQESKLNKETDEIILPHNIPLHIGFSKNWKRQKEWFDIVNEKAINQEHTASDEQVDKLIAAKEEELAMLKKALKSKKDDAALVQKQKDLAAELEQLQSAQSTLSDKSKKHLPEYRQKFRRHAAESRFFNPTRSKKSAELLSLVEAIIDHRFMTGGNELNLIDLANRSTRLVITAERLFQETVIALSGDERPALGIPIARKKGWSIGYSSGYTYYGPVEKYQIGNTLIKAEHRADPKRQRLGDSFLPEHGTYDADIYPFLHRLSNGEAAKEKKLASLMIRYSNKHIVVTLNELKEIYPDADDDDVNHFHKICFLITEKEQAQWHSATDEDYQLGLAVAQARCLILIEAGLLSFKEAFKNDVLFGVYSSTGIMNNHRGIAESCLYIEKLYRHYLQGKHADDYLKFFKSHIKETSLPTCVLTREQAHLDLKQVYGGASDTEDEGYETDLSI